MAGTEVYHQAGAFRFEPGPIFANIVLADEINRAPAKVQAALLEAMEERQVTVAGKTHRMRRPARRDPLRARRARPRRRCRLRGAGGGGWPRCRDPVGRRIGGGARGNARGDVSAALAALAVWNGRLPPVPGTAEEEQLRAALVGLGAARYEPAPSRSDGGATGAALSVLSTARQARHRAAASAAANPLPPLNPLGRLRPDCL